jgi:lysozyme
VTIVELLIRHEGLQLEPYIDTTGHLTIGVGHNLNDKPISRRAAMTILGDDIDDAAGALQKNCAPWFPLIGDVRQSVLIDMCFQLGWEGLRQFQHTLGCIAAGNYLAAADSMLASLWARQVPGRAAELAQMMRTGMWPP